MVSRIDTPGFSVSLGVWRYKGGEKIWAGIRIQIAGNKHGNGPHDFWWAWGVLINDRCSVLNRHRS
jgi:hypothetical protein